MSFAQEYLDLMTECQRKIRNLKNEYGPIVKFFAAFGQALKQTTHHHNWDDDNGVQEDILKDTIKILGLDENVVRTALLHEELWDFIPGSCDYPIHTILSITACPVQDEIVFF